MPEVKDRLADYVPVSERLEQFWGQWEQGRVLTTILEHNSEEGFILMRAEIYRTQEETTPAATGHAFENRTAGYVNKTSYIENCETSAVGRALALLGYEIKRGIASREEMQKVERMSQPRPTKDEQQDVERAKLTDAIKKAGGLLNKLGDVPPWTAKRCDAFANENFNTSGGVEVLTVPQLGELASLMTKRIDDLKKKKQPTEREEVERRAKVEALRAQNTPEIIAKGMKDIYPDYPGALDTLTLDQLIHFETELVPF